MTHRTQIKLHLTGKPSLILVILKIPFYRRANSISSPLPQGSHEIAVRMCTSVLSLRAFRKEEKIFLERLSTIISSISTFFTSNSQEYCLVNLINFYTMTEDGIADGFPGRMSRPEAGATPLTGLLQGQASIVQLTQASLSQTEAFKNLKEDLLLLPDSQDERSDEEEPNHDVVDPTAAVNALLDTNKGAHVAKSADGQDQRSTTEQDIIDSLTQALKSKPKKSPPIDAKIASFVDDILTGDLSADMAREKGEKYPPPENCKHLQAITINEEVWDLMSRKNKLIDLAFQKVQEPLVEGLSALAILSDCLVKDVQSSKTTNTP